MNKLDHALAWAARGLPVFPLMAGSKGQPLLKGFHVHATTDEATIRKWWTHDDGSIADHNIGVSTTGLVVLDVDVRDGKKGLASMAELLDAEERDTLTVRTPSGGYHLYFNGPSSAGRLGLLGDDSGLDIRSYHNFVVAPGSTTADGVYEIHNDKPIQYVPGLFESLLVKPSTKRVQASTVPVDERAAAAAAEHYLNTAAPIAIEGRHGDEETYRVACRMRDYGVEEETAFDLMLDSWNLRCVPPWSPAELRRKVANAYAYASGEQGLLAPDRVFGGATVIEPPKPEPAPPPIPAAAIAVIPPVFAIPPRPWVIPGLLMRGAVSLLVSPGGSGKSTFMLSIAAHLCLGKDFGRYKARSPGRVVIFDAEDDLDETGRRLFAVCHEFNLPHDEVRRRLTVLDPMQTSIMLAYKVGRTPTPNAEHIQALVDVASDPDVVALFLDPLIDLHACEEDQNVDMRVVMGLLTKVAMDAGVSVFVSHHTSKGGTERHGSQDAARGASAIVNKSRIALTMFHMSEADRMRYGVSEQDAIDYVRVDGAKANYGRRGENQWFKRVSCRLPNGDEVGVLRPHDMQDDAVGVKLLVARVFIRTLIEKGTSRMSLSDAIEALRVNETIYSTTPTTTLRDIVTRMFTMPVSMDDARVQIVRENSHVYIAMV